MALPHPRFLTEDPEPDLDLLRCELVSLYKQCMADMDCADSLRAEYEERIRQAVEMRRAAETRSEKVRALLDSEFPEWSGR